MFGSLLRYVWRVLFKFICLYLNLLGRIKWLISHSCHSSECKPPVTVPLCRLLSESVHSFVFYFWMQRLTDVQGRYVDFGPVSPYQSNISVISHLCLERDDNNLKLLPVVFSVVTWFPAQWRSYRSVHWWDDPASAQTPGSALESQLLRTGFSRPPKASGGVLWGQPCSCFGQIGKMIWTKSWRSYLC